MRGLVDRGQPPWTSCGLLVWDLLGVPPETRFFGLLVYLGIMGSHSEGNRERERGDEGAGEQVTAVSF